MNKTLVILAAGIGSRFGGGIKQLEPVDDYGHIIIDYSIHDAIAAGFTKIVFIIRHDIEKDFREVIGNRIEKVCAAHKVEVAYAFQKLSDITYFAGKEKTAEDSGSEKTKRQRPENGEMPEGFDPSQFGGNMPVGSSRSVG